jgi:hypothetical protein
MYRQLITILLLVVLLACSAAAQAASTSKPPAPPLPPISVVSIIPAQGEPGMIVTLNGSGFTTASSVFLGSRELPAQVVGGKILSFELPDLSPGVYALYLKREDGSTSKPYNFQLLPQRPVAGSLAPDTVSSCASGRDREVVLTGANFLPGTRVVLDGAAIATRVISPAALSFVAPQLPAGLHQVQVKNPPEVVSGTLALFIDSKPEILGVAVGSEYVNYYELVVTGRNFLQTSLLVADGNRIGTGRPVAGERDQLVFVGCNQLIYQRHPYDPTPKDVRLQVVNPNGEESNLFTISAP